MKKRINITIDPEQHELGKQFAKSIGTSFSSLIETLLNKLKIEEISNKKTTITIFFKGVFLNVQYDYIAEEKEVRYNSDQSGYPGSPESVDINAVYHAAEDITELLDDYLEEIESIVLKSLSDE
jgi:hypothetical protein